MRWKLGHINEIGKKEENQDSTFPYTMSDAENSNLFLVCDGVGGSTHGEVASALVCERFNRYINLHPGSEINEQFLTDGLEFVRTSLVAYAEENPETEKMATTLTLVYFEEGKGAHVCWIGDSRVYHFKKGKIDYVTKDHSLVQKLIDEGELTEESAKEFKQKNVILRAIHANLEPLEMSYHLIPQSNIDVEDVFMLCSDGVMEAWTDDELTTLMSSGDSVKEINNTISNKCLSDSRDNYSAYIIGVNEQLKGVPKKKGKIIGLLLVIAIVIAGVIFLIVWAQEREVKPIDINLPPNKTLPVPIEIPDTTKEIKKKKAEELKPDHTIVEEKRETNQDLRGEHDRNAYGVLEVDKGSQTKPDTSKSNKPSALIDNINGNEINDPNDK
jgi:serine/threonine protein phosphatase PrpC